MNRENMAKWVEALRSGKYQQGKKKLRTAEGYCCLGVACDISGLGQWAGSVYTVGDQSSDLVLPFAVQNWLGISSENPSVQWNFTDTPLAVLNDGEERDWADDVEPQPFSVIADLIEEKYLS